MSDFGFWKLEMESDYDGLSTSVETVAGVLSALFCESVPQNHHSEAEPLSEDDTPSTRSPKRGKKRPTCHFKDAKGQFLVQLPHFGISRHFTSRKEAKEFIFYTFQNVEPKLKPTSAVSHLDDIASKVREEWGYMSTICVSTFRLDPNDYNRLCVAWEDGIDAERWLSLPYGYAPEESPFDPARKRLQPFFGPKWRSQLSNPCAKLAKIMDSLNLYYITSQGEVRKIGKVAEEKKCLDMEASTCSLLTEQEFEALKMGFGPSDVQWSCRICQGDFHEEYATVQDYMASVKEHYMTHEDFGHAPFIAHHAEIRKQYMADESEMMETVFHKLKDVEIGSTSCYGWHKDEVLSDVKDIVTYKK